MTYSLNKHELQQILRDQRKEIESLHSKWLPREKLHEFKSLLSSKLVKVVMGIRRSGKSTLCIHALPFEQFVYINFDDERLIRLTTKDLQTVYEVMTQLNPQAQFYIFDEIQNIDSWELFINRLKRKGLNIIVTGSNGQLLSKELATHLTGRHLSLELMPFSFYEFLGYKNASIELNEASS
ncbi:MAG TPA: AAA family ATPase, partial [Pseudobdellovibrionaceae bacterium]